MRNWLRPHRTLRGLSVLAEAAHADTGVEPAHTDADAGAELISQVLRRHDNIAPAANVSSWLPPLWLSW